MMHSGPQRITVQSGTEQNAVCSGAERIVEQSGIKQIMMCSEAEVNMVRSGTEPVSVHSGPDLLVWLFWSAYIFRSSE